MGGKGRIAWIDVIRALGACSIVLLHVLTSTFQNYEIPQVQKNVYFFVTIVLSRWAVPGFFMVTGYLLMDPARNVTWRRAARYAWRMVVVILTFGLAFALMEESWYAIAAGSGLGLGIIVRALVDVLTVATWDHLWYVYALIGVYLVVPALRAFRARWGQRAFHLLSLALFVGLLVVPTVLRYLHVNSIFWPNVIPEQIFNTMIGITCFCVGGCLVDLRLGPATIALGVASLAAMLAECGHGLWMGWGSQNFMYMHSSCFACAYAVLVLLLARRFVGDGLESPVVDALARDSFGIYVIHPLYVHLLLMAINPVTVPPVVYEVASFSVVLALSMVTTRLLRKVPLFDGVL